MSGLTIKQGIPKECYILEPGTNKYLCAKCGKPIKMRYPGGDPENGPARTDCPSDHIEFYLDRKYEVLVGRADQIWEMLKRVAPENHDDARELIKTITEEMEEVKFK